MTVVSAVGALLGRTPTSLPPLHDTVDVDALESIFTERTATGRVWFRYCDHVVEVRGGDVVLVFADEGETTD